MQLSRNNQYYLSGPGDPEEALTNSIPATALGLAHKSLGSALFLLPKHLSLPSDSIVYYKITYIDSFFPCVCWAIQPAGLTWGPFPFSEWYGNIFDYDKK
jgi:hypothetical protein